MANKRKYHLFTTCTSIRDGGKKNQGTKQQQQPSVMDTMPPQIEQRRNIIQGSELPDGRGIELLFNKALYSLLKKVIKLIILTVR